MNDGRPNSNLSAQAWICTGAALFLVALLVSAILVPGLRLLHLLQALIYIAVIILARRNSAWGFGAGFTIAMVWNAMNLFLTHLMKEGAVAFWSMLRTGRVEHPVQMMVALGGVGHFVLIVASLFAIVRCNAEPRKWWKFVGGGAIAVAYFALLVALFRPH